MNVFRLLKTIPFVIITFSVLYRVAALCLLHAMDILIFNE